jgi:hypothetical protein
MNLQAMDLLFDCWSRIAGVKKTFAIMRPTNRRKLNLNEIETETQKKIMNGSVDYYYYKVKREYDE